MPDLNKDMWASLARGPVEPLLAECKPRLQSNLSWLLEGDGRQSGAAEDGISHALEVLNKHYEGNATQPYPYYLVTARNKAYDILERPFQAPVDMTDLESNPALASRLSAGHVFSPCELSGFSARFLAERVGMSEAEIEDFDGDRREIAAVAADAIGSGLIGTNSELVAGVLRRNPHTRAVLDAVEHLTATRSAIDRPLVAAAVTSALVHTRADEALLLRYVRQVVGAETRTGAHARRVERIMHDLLRKPVPAA